MADSGAAIMLAENLPDPNGWDLIALSGLRSAEVEAGTGTGTEAAPHAELHALLTECQRAVTELSDQLGGATSATPTAPPAASWPECPFTGPTTPMRLRVLHQTTYHYQSPVVLGQHIAHLRPTEATGQTLISHSFHVDPLPAHLEDSRDAFGNWRTFFALQSSHQSLTVVADSVVDTVPARPLEHAMTWEAAREQFRYRAGASYQPASEFVFPSPYVPRDEAFADEARPLFTPSAHCCKPAKRS
jgi:hypothetical protein